MIVSPELMSASSAPWARPLNSCERKLDQVSMAGTTKRGSRRLADCRAWSLGSSGVRAEVAAEGVGLLHQASARDDLDHFPEVLLVLHVLGRLAPDDHHGTDELVVCAAPLDLADHRVELARRLVRLDDIGRIER